MAKQHCNFASFRNAEFMELKCELSKSQETLYDAAVQLWQVMQLCFSSTRLQCTSHLSAEKPRIYANSLMVPHYFH
jgi:hypothetical protein